MKRVVPLFREDNNDSIVAGSQTINAIDQEATIRPLINLLTSAKTMNSTKILNFSIAISE